MGAPGAGSDRWAIARPPAEREALNLVLDVLAQPARHSHIRRSLYSAKEKGFVSLRKIKDL